MRRLCTATTRGRLPRPATHPSEVLQWPATVLAQSQREAYFADGCLTLPSFVGAGWVRRLAAAARALVEESRAMAPPAPGGPPDAMSWSRGRRGHFLLEEGHTPEAPRVTRVAAPVDVEPDVFWEFCLSEGGPADVARELLGPDVRYHHSKLNFKLAGAGGRTRVHWHQDIQFWPHTNYSPLTVGVYLEDTDEAMGPMHVLPLSVHDELHALEDAEGNWTGVLGEEALRRIGPPLGERARSMVGPAGTVTVHNARCVHGGPPNTSERHRPLLLYTFAAATAHPLPGGTNPLHAQSSRGCPMVRECPSRLAVFDPQARPCPMAPSFAAGYRPPFFAQQDDG